MVTREVEQQNDNRYLKRDLYRVTEGDTGR